ncbi:MAG TPA: peptidoglycan-binding domain-containing protein [Terriglobales bacterium]|nr:peptidoglycan-binding domain-containing protein [Terriglobales bacterium]
MAAALTNVLREGMRGEVVKGLQQALRALGYDVPVTEDAVFGPGTEDALKAFQKASGIEESGVVDEPTKAALAKAIAVKKAAASAALTVLPSAGAPVAAAAAVGAAAAAESAFAEAPSQTPFWKEPWFALTATGALAVGVALMVRRSRARALPPARPRRRRRRAAAAFDAFADTEAIEQFNEAIAGDDEGEPDEGDDETPETDADNDSTNESTDEAPAPKRKPTRRKKAAKAA